MSESAETLARQMDGLLKQKHAEALARMSDAEKAVLESNREAIREISKQVTEDIADACTRRKGAIEAICQDQQSLCTGVYIDGLCRNLAGIIALHHPDYRTSVLEDIVAAIHVYAAKYAMQQER